MSEPRDPTATNPGPEPAPAAPPRAGRRLVRRAVIVAAVALLAGAVVGSLIAFRQAPPSETATESTAGEPLDLAFSDAMGGTHSLADFRGKAMVLNLWATWCVPCREEMPTLDRLQAKLGGADFQVLAISVDRGGPERVAAFLDEIGTEHLAIYMADMAAVRRSIGVVGLPTTLLVDRDGREIHRVVGPAEWDSPEMMALVAERLDLGPLTDAQAEGDGSEGEGS